MYRKSLYLYLVLLFIAVFVFSSCTKKTDETSQEKNNEVTTEAVSDSNFTETDEDLLTVDYKQFYDELAPHGEWVQVSSKDLGLDLKGEAENSSLLNDLFGIKNAYANADLGMFFVWKPSPDLAVTVSTGEPAVYTPYTNGQWVNTDDGWYFKAPTPYEETTSHYGRWAYSPALGWVWLPGRVWSPAWVEWRENDNYIAWAPVPPSVYIVNSVLPPVVIADDRYIIVDKRHFIEPSVYKYRYSYKENKNKIMIKEMTKIDGVMIKNKTVINKGPDPVSIENVTGKKIVTVKINKVKNRNDVKYTEKEINVYSRGFTKSNGKDKKESVTKPEKFVPYSDAENMSKKESKEKEMKKEDKGKEKSDKEKGFEKQKVNGNEKGVDKQKGNKKLGDDRDMKKGNKKFQEEKKQEHEKGNKNMKQNEPKEKSNNKGKH